MKWPRYVSLQQAGLLRSHVYLVSRDDGSMWGDIYASADAAVDAIEASYSDPVFYADVEFEVKTQRGRSGKSVVVYVDKPGAWAVVYCVYPQKVIG